MRLAGGKSNEATCAGTVSFMNLDGPRIDKERATDLLHAYGINHWHIHGPVAYPQGLYKLGVLGPGKRSNAICRLSNLGNWNLLKR